MGSARDRRCLEGALAAARRAGARQAEAFLASGSSRSADMTERGLQTYRGSSARGIGLRVVRRGRLGFSYGQELGSAGLARLAENAVAAAALADVEGFPLLEGGAALPDLGTLDAGGLAAAFAEDAELLAAVVRDAKGGHPAFRRIKQVTLRSGRTEVAVRSSAGTDTAYARSSFTLVAGVVAERGGASEMGWEADTRVRRDELPWAWIGSAAAIRAGERLGAGRPPAGRQPVILDREVVAELLGVLGAAFSADAVRKGKSLVGKRRGERVLAGAVTLVDDPLERGVPGSAPCDDEGQPTRRTTLVDRGRITAWLHTLESSSRMGEGAGGSGYRRSWEALPAPRAANLRLEPGAGSPEAWVGARGRTILVDEIIGAHTINPVSGDFSVGAAGFVCEPGRRRPFRGATIAGNLVELFGAVEAVGSDVRRYGGVAAPSVLVGRLDVSA